jgi:hypothetical protein
VREIIYLTSSPTYATLRGQPRFEKLLAIIFCLRVNAHGAAGISSPPAAPPHSIRGDMTQLSKAATPLWTAVAKATAL